MFESLKGKGAYVHNSREGICECAVVGEEKSVGLLPDSLSYSSAWVGYACVSAVLELTVVS